MKEIWDLAISPGVLPFTLLLIPVALYWALAGFGMVDMNLFDADIDVDVDASTNGIDGGDASDGPGVIKGAVLGGLHLLNARDVPLMMVLSLLFVLNWGCAMIVNMILGTGGEGSLALVAGLGGFVAAIFFTRLMTAPLKPFFRSLKGDDEHHRPVVGRSGIVRSGEITDRSGQVEIEENGEVLLLNARLGEGDFPLERGTEVIVYNYDSESGIYYVKNLSN